MMNRLFTVSAVALLAISCAHAPAQPSAAPAQSPPRDQPVRVVGNSELQKLQDAIAPYVQKARSTYPPIRERFLAGLPDGAALFITTQLHDEAGKMEQVFVQVEKIEADKITGIIWDDIRTVSGFHKGQRYSFPEAQLIDWTISNADGTEEGNVVGTFLDSWHGMVP